MILSEIAWATSGDKGNNSNICVFPYDDADFDYLKEVLTADVVAAHFANRMDNGVVTRFEYTGMKALNFVLTNALGGGVSRSLRVDPHGKAFQSYVLTIDLGDR
jgi:hypothetical protein